MIILALILFVFAIVSSILYHKFGLFKTFYHDVLHWHIPDKYIWADGISTHTFCRHCGKELMQDSQGNWY